MGQVQKPQSTANEKGTSEGKRNLPFRHPDFSDDQIRQLTDIGRSYRSSSSVASKRSTSRPPSGCSSPILSPTIQRLRTEGFPPLARCGSDPLLHGAPQQHAMNTGSLPADLLPPAPSSPSPTPRPSHQHQHHHHHHPRRHHHHRDHRSMDAAARDPGGGGGGGGGGGVTTGGERAYTGGGGVGGGGVGGSGINSITHSSFTSGGSLGSTGGTGGSGGGRASDKELLGLLMSRLVAMEAQISHARQALRQRDFHIAVLEEKLRLYMKAEEDAVGSKTGFLDKLKDSRMASVEEKCLKLERQVMEMERFLGEYGMVWCEAEETYLLDNPVNASCSYSSSEATTPTATPSHGPRSHPRVRIKRHRRNHKNREVRRVVAESTSRSISSEAEPFSLDYEKLLAAITELNIVAQGDAAAEAGESLQLTLYKNGIVVDDGRFRSFEMVQTRQFLQDILDGFFPSELQDTYPEGVPIKVRDKRQVIFLPNSSRRKPTPRPPVPPKPRLPPAQTDSLTSVTSTLFSSISEPEPRPADSAHQPPDPDDSTAPPAAPQPAADSSGDPSRLCPDVEYRSESSDVSSRRNSLQRGSDKSEGEGKESGLGRRGSELWRPVEAVAAAAAAAAVVTGARRDGRRESEGRRGSDHRTHQCRRGSECRRSSELVRTTLDLDLGRRATSKHPLEWNRINRTAFLLNDDTFDSNGNHMRRGSLGVMAGDPYDVESLRKRRTSVEDFLAKVPTCVVKNGKIVNLREEVADMLMGPSRKNSLTLVHTPVLDETGESQESNDPDTQDSTTTITATPATTDHHHHHQQAAATTTLAATAAAAANVSSTSTTTAAHHHHHHHHHHQDHAHGPTRTTLRIKVENGSETYLIKLKASDTLQTLRSYLRSYRGDNEDFLIVRTYPYQVLDQGEATMAELGLTPNAALHLKVAARPLPPESLSLVSGGVAATAMMTHGATGQTVAPTQPQSSPTPRRAPSPLPQIPPNLHPDLLPPLVPILCFPDAHEASDRES
ncbi:uncharacterized protein LOC126999281 [Eriocheir sinensis]|uniref:uncharacterized protein LOC126999281 n=1 Tax=Eriocheir sinensis TaxID=95602 RepID=UPI0021C827C6|nr:uncharacterized protein LOC126999281 [Eriocheir sinensis]